MATLSDLAQCVLSGDDELVEKQTRALLDIGVSPLEIINQGLIGGMNLVGPLFKDGDMFVPEVLMSAKAMAVGINICKALISEGDMQSQGKIIIGTVKGDLHDIGKNLVGMMLESSGFMVIDLGIDIPAEKFVEAIKANDPDIVAMSALLTTTMQQMKNTIDLIKEEGLQVKCIIGGAPVSQDYANKIGADGFSPDAATAVDLCRKLMAV